MHLGSRCGATRRLYGLEERFAAHGWKMAANNLKQADVITGATVLPNTNGICSRALDQRQVRRPREDHDIAARSSA